MDIPSTLFGIAIGAVLTAGGFIYYFVLKVAKESSIKDSADTQPKR